MILSKAIGQNINKSVSNSLDYIMYISAGVAFTISAGCNNILGVDQKG
jgi:hypothetical protein